MTEKAGIVLVSIHQTVLITLEILVSSIKLQLLIKSEIFQYLIVIVKRKILKQVKRTNIKQPGKMIHLVTQNKSVLPSFNKYHHGVTVMWSHTGPLRSAFISFTQLHTCGLASVRM